VAVKQGLESRSESWILHHVIVDFLSFELVPHDFLGEVGNVSVDEVEVADQG
jgi:hypothetical protein